MWDERYRDSQYAYGTEPNDFLKEKYTVLPKGRVLCLAEGEGRNAVFLAKQGYQVVAVDASVEGMKKAKQLAEINNVDIEYMVADLSSFEIEEAAFDAVISIFCHVPLAVRQALHERVVRGLKPSGVLLLEAYTPAQLQHKTGGPPVEELTMQLDDLLQEFQGLQMQHAVEFEREVVEGIYHTGRGAVVQLIGIKHSG